MNGAILALIGIEIPGRALRVNISLDEGLLARIDKAAASAGQRARGPWRAGRGSGSKGWGREATLLRDFWSEVDAALRTRGIIP